MSDLTVEAVRERWREVVDALGAQPEMRMVAAALATAQPLRVAGPTVTVAFPVEATFARRKVAEHAEAVDRALVQVFGPGVRAEFVHDESVQGATIAPAEDLFAPAPDVTPEQAEAAARRRHWQEIRDRRVAFAEGRCEVCNTAKGGLQVHHRTYEREGHERLNDLIALCAGCHLLFHKHGKLRKW